LEETTCLVLGRDVLFNILGEPLQTIGFKNLRRIAIERNYELSKLTKMQQEKLMDRFEFQTGKKDQVLVRKGEKYSNLIIPLDQNLITVNLFERSINFFRKTQKKFLFIEGSALARIIYGKK
jgi:hypothetical protein